MNKMFNAADTLQGKELTQARWPATLTVSISTPKGTIISREVTIQDIWQDEVALKRRALGLTEYLFDAIYSKIYHTLPEHNFELVQVQGSRKDTVNGRHRQHS